MKPGSNFIFQSMNQHREVKQHILLSQNQDKKQVSQPCSWLNLCVTWTETEPWLSFIVNVKNKRKEPIVVQQVTSDLKPKDQLRSSSSLTHAQINACFQKMYHFCFGFFETGFPYSPKYIRLATTHTHQLNIFTHKYIYNYWLYYTYTHMSHEKPGTTLI